MAPSVPLPAPKAVAVFGAAGHTGRFVVHELLCHGITPVAVARNLASLAAAGFPEHKVLLRQATVADTPSLLRAFEGAVAVINCAGPFLETADPVANAALHLGLHYLDVTAEQPSARELLDKYDAVARTAGVAVIPSMSFYGGFVDLLATAAMAGWDRADTIDVMIGLDSWYPTRGTRITGEKNTSERMVVSAGKLVPVASPRPQRDWDFGGSLGQQQMVEVPFAEMVLLHRHLKTFELHTWLNRPALDDIHDVSTPLPQAVDDSGRSSQRFIVEVVTTRNGEARRIAARGRDIYAFSATLICKAVERLLDGRFSGAGAHPAGVAFNALDLLSALSPDYLMVS
jgi:NAD(P)-dependent dehydrogenase (short-subunit alcohol dehydrogenase family)